MTTFNFKSIFFAFIAFISFSISASADGGYCNKNYWYENIQHGATYSAGQDVYVKVKAQKHYDIAHMTLYINGYKVRTESSAPYEWGRPNGGGDHYLRNLKTGNYKLKCVVKTKCGGTYYKYLDFYVRGGHGGGHNGGACANNYRYMYGQNGCQAGRDLYVKVGADYHNRVEYMELYINGYKVRREMHAPYEWGKPNTNGDHYLRNMKRGTYQLKCKIKTKCGGVEWKEKTITVH